MTLFDDDPEALHYEDEGRAAAEAGARFRSPYEPGTQAERLWNRGFIRVRLAQQEARKERALISA